MIPWKMAALRPRPAVACRSSRRASHILKTLLAAAAIAASPEALGGFAQAAVPSGLQPYVVQNDRGGFVRDRLREIRNLRSTGQRVEIRGRICYSTCTMLLGLPQTCISPDTVFGFHGPARNGRRLKGEDFEYYSRVIAQYYPAPLQEWYMAKGRLRIAGVHKIKGEHIIKMGIQAC